MQQAAAATAAATATAFKKSGVQKQILGLYKSFMRELKHKPLEQRNSFKIHIRQQFKDKKDVPRTEMRIIEHWLQFGKRQLKLFKSDSSMQMSFYSPDRKTITPPTPPHSNHHNHKK